MKTQSIFKNKISLLAVGSFLFLTSICGVQAEGRKTGFFVGLDLFSAYATDGSGASGTGGGVLLGFDLMPELSLEGSFSIGVSGEPYDAIEDRIMGTLTGYWPLSETFQPFALLSAGGGSFEDEGDSGSALQFVVGGGIGFAWFFSRRNALRLRLEELIHLTQSVDGNFHTLGLGLNYRFTF